MKQSTNGMGLAKACCFTAILNCVFTPAYGQDPGSGGSDYDSEWSERLFQYGPFDLRPYVKGGVVYDDNFATTAEKLISQVPGVTDVDNQTRVLSHSIIGP